MSKKLSIATGASLIFLGIYLNIPFSILSAIFEYPQILRKPTADVLVKFHDGGTGLIAAWYAFTLAAVMMIAVVAMLRQALQNENKALISIAANFGILAGLVQVLGLIRWVFLVPVLANTYTDPASDAAVRAASVVVFNAFHQYAGVGLGEHLGQLFTVIWLALTSIALIRSTQFGRVLGIAGILIAGLLMAGLTEGFATVVSFDPGAFAFVTPVGFIGLSVWMIFLGATLIAKGRKG